MRNSSLHLQRSTQLLVAGKREPLGLFQHLKGLAHFWTGLMSPEKTQSPNVLNRQGLLGTQSSLSKMVAGAEVQLQQCQHIKNMARRRVVRQVEEAPMQLITFIKSQQVLVLQYQTLV